MKNTNRNIAFGASAIFAVVLCILLVIIQLLRHSSIDVITVLSTAFLVFILGGYVIDFVLNKFVQEKVRLIYQLIQSNKSITSKVPKNLEEINTSVEKWVLDSKNELEAFKLQENFRREFIGNVSHELKTPIFNIQGYVMTLMDGALYDENYNLKYLGRTMNSVDRMIDLVEDLETISLLETDSIELDKSKFDLLALVGETHEALEFKAEKRSIKLKYDSQVGKVVMVHADRKRVRQVIENLVVNAIKYGKEEGEVSVNVYDIDANVLVEVADDGIGIEENSLPRVFERFYRADKGRSRQQGGSGLGLSIVKHIIEAHEQNIHVRSTINEGSVFSFTLAKAL
ncbi:MAG: two-component system phosphate regulon sensor histidine kinase PhoR [Flavobacteriales bacterium]